jgi:hypothetical protein
MLIDERMERLLQFRKAKILETFAEHLRDPDRNIICCAALDGSRRVPELTRRFGIGRLTPAMEAASISPMVLVLTHMAAEPSEPMATPFLEGRRTRVRLAAQNSLASIQGAEIARQGRSGASLGMRSDR